MNIRKKENLNFITLYNSFTEKERIEFRIFLQNEKESGRNYVQILDSINFNATGATGIFSSKSRITKWNRLSELQHLAEKFLTIRSYKEKSLINRYFLMKEYKDRKLYPLFEKTYKTHKKNILSKPVINYDANIINAIDILYTDYLLKNSDTKQFGGKLTEIAEYKLGVKFVNLLEYMIELWTRKINKPVTLSTFEEDIFKLFEIDKILLNLSNSFYTQNKMYPLINFLHHLSLCTKDLSDNLNFRKAKRIFFKELRFISPEKREKYYTFMILYGIEKYNRGFFEISEDLFFIIDQKLKEGFTSDLENKDLTLNNFRNYILIALNMNKLTWVNDFIKKYGPYLHHEIRDLELFGKAILMFKANDFKSCKDLLLKIKKNNPYTFIDISVLKLKVLYELKLYDTCHDELKKTNEYLRKKRSVNDLLIIYSKLFCKAYALLLRIIQNPSEKNINEIQFLLSNELMIGKKWINEKLNSATNHTRRKS